MITDNQLNEMLNQFSCIWPSMGATMSHDQKMGYATQLEAALSENGLDNGDAVREGFRKARTEGGQYLPSVPTFVGWCKVERKEQCHNLLPRVVTTESTAEQREQLRIDMAAALKGIK